MDADRAIPPEKERRMKPEEAIELLRSMQNPKQDYANLVCAPAFCTGYRYVYPEPEDYAIEEAISALKEVQQYRAIGTVEECRVMESIISKVERNELAKIIDEWLLYRKIGTVEECQEAVEKQKPKAVMNRKLLKDFHGSPYCIQGDCPNCGCKSIKATATDYCYVCGQHLKWNENLEGMEDE